MTVEQIRVGRDNFSYLGHCISSKKAALVDPGMDATKALDLIDSNGLDLVYIINTHHHGDHTADNQRVKEAHPQAEIIANEGDSERAVEDDEVIMLGEVKLRFITTPGHTPGGICIIVDDEVILTGDTLFIGNCGRTDLPGSSDEQMFSSLKNKLGRLPDELIVYPGHDYGPKPTETLGNQKLNNPTLAAKNLEEFLRIP
jgi:glyoxylase-like metal-dependent hydrolase (beta-lactamase superfamily II)